MNIVVFASHNGSGFQAIIDACADGNLHASVRVVISNNGNSMALQRAKNAGISSYLLNVMMSGSEEKLEEEIFRAFPHLI